MKKQLLAGAFVLASFLTAQAQELQAENFNDLPVGNVGTDLTGATAGVGGFRTFVATNGSNSDFQIVAGGNDGNGLTIFGGDLPSGTTQETDNRRFLWKETGIDWASRTAGNDLITVEFDFNSAMVAGSTSLHRFQILGTPDGTAGRVMGGYEYDAATGELAGIVYFSQNGQAGTYTIGLGPNLQNPLIIPQNTWITLGLAIDPATGDVLWASNDILVEDEEGEMVPFQAGFASTFAAGLTAVEADFIVIPGANNAAVSSSNWDNLSIKAAADLSDFLGTEEVIAATNLSVFPNPVNDVVNVTVDALVSNVAIVDLNGRTVKSVKFDGVSNASVNVSDLSAGVYMMTVSSDKGTTTKKIVKN